MHITVRNHEDTFIAMTCDKKFNHCRQVTIPFHVNVFKFEARISAYYIPRKTEAKLSLHNPQNRGDMLTACHTIQVSPSHCIPHRHEDNLLAAAFFFRGVHILASITARL